MSWLLPTVVIPGGTLRTVGEPPLKEVIRARRQRWYLRNSSGYRRRRSLDPVYKAQANERSRNWYHSAKGQAWREKNRERRNAYYRAYMTPYRRDYIARKAREYRADPVRNLLINQRRREKYAAKKASA